MSRPRAAHLGIGLLLAIGGMFPGVPSQLAAAGQRVPVCSLAAGLKAKVDGQNGASGNTYLYIEFVNTGSAACALRGVPGVQPVTQMAHSSVGPSSRHVTSQGRGGTVRLDARGGKANIVYWTFVVAEEPARCRPRTTNGIMIHFDGVRAFFIVIHFPTGLASEVCTTLRSTTGDGVGTGRSGGP